MKVYFESVSFKVKNEEGKVFRAYTLETYSGCNYITINLVGVDDEEDGDSVNCYMMQESVTEALEANGYEIVEE